MTGREAGLSLPWQSSTTESSLLTGIDPQADAALETQLSADARLRTRRLNALPDLAGFVILVLLVGLGSIYAVYSVQRRSDSLNALLTTRTQLTLLAKSKAELETGAVGFVATGDDEFLKIHDQARRDVSNYEEALWQSIVTPDDRGVLEELLAVEQGVVAEISAVVALARSQKKAEAMQRIGARAGRDLMRRTSALAESLLTTNARRIDELRKTTQSAETIVYSVIIAGCCAVLALGLLWLRGTQRQLGLIPGLVERLRTANGTLAQGVQDKIAEKTRALDREKTLALLKALTDSTTDLIFAKDREGRMIFANPATLRVIGKDWAEIKGRRDDEWHDRLDEAKSIIAHDRRVIETGTPEAFEENFTTDDKPVTFLSTKSPLYDSSGTIIGVVGLSTDITERKANEEQRQFLMRELTHRSKNLLAVVQSMARQTATMSGSLDDFQGRFSARLQGLASSQDLLLQENWRGASIRQLIISQLGHLTDMIDSRILLTGPDGLLNPDAAQNIGLALHELSTNAAKYGALSNIAGRVYIRWGLLPGGPDGEKFFLNWQEDGGPPVTPPGRKGFGHSVVQRLVARSLDGKVDLDFKPEGVVWRLEIPRAHIMQIQEENMPEASASAEQQ